MFEPLRKLHEKQAQAKFSAVAKTPVLFGDDVVYVKRRLGRILREVAILATTIGALNDHRFQGATRASQCAQAALSRSEFLAGDFSSSSSRPTCR